MNIENIQMPYPARDHKTISNRPKTIGQGIVAQTPTGFSQRGKTPLDDRKTTSQGK
jgi:hypothetical protein